MWPKTIPLMPSFIKEISITIKNLIWPQISTAHQADAKYKDRAFEKDIQLNPQRICIFHCPQVTHIILPTTKTQEVSKELVKLLIRNRATIWRTTRNIRRYTKLIDQKDNLQKIKCELKRIVNPRLQNTAQKMAVKKLTDLPPINIYYISAIGFY